MLLSTLLADHQPLNNTGRDLPHKRPLVTKCYERSF